MQWGCFFTSLQIALPAKEPSGEEASFILWHSLHVVELSALLQAFLEVLVEESYGWQE